MGEDISEHSGQINSDNQPILPHKVVFNSDREGQPIDMGLVEPIKSTIEQAVTKVLEQNPHLSGMLIVGSAATLYTPDNIRMHGGSDIEVIPISRENVADPVERNETAFKTRGQLQEALDTRNLSIRVEAFYPPIFGRGEALTPQIENILEQLGTKDFHIIESLKLEHNS